MGDDVVPVGGEGKLRLGNWGGGGGATNSTQLLDLSEVTADSSHYYQCEGVFGTEPPSSDSPNQYKFHHFLVFR